jgi:hypothetical protein
MIAPLAKLIDWSVVQVRTIRTNGLILLMFLALNVGRAGPVELLPQIITLPANAGPPLFVDIDGDGRSDLLVIDPLEKKLLNYHQRVDGFTNSPDQVIPLPPQTAWVAVCDVEAHPGLELLMSTATGLVYSRQNAGRFESERRPLIEVSQVFTNNDFPILTSLSTNQAGTNDLIPVISAGQAVLYHRNSAYEWSPGPPLTLDVKQTSWSVNRDPWLHAWTLGPNPGHSLRVQQSFCAQPGPERDQEPENETIRKLIADMKKNGEAGIIKMDRVDIDGDGKIWFCGSTASTWVSKPTSTSSCAARTRSCRSGRRKFCTVAGRRFPSVPRKSGRPYTI